MQKLFRIGFLTLALTFMLSAFAAPETKAQTNNEILNMMDNHYKALQNLRTNVLYRKYDSGIKEWTDMEGTAIFMPQKDKKAIFKVDWTKPMESLSVVKDKYVIYRERLNQCYVGSTTSKVKGSAGVSNPFAFISMSKSQLKANYSIKYLGKETLSNGTQTLRLELTPKTKQSYKIAEIWIDSDGMPVQMKVVENNNDTSSILLSKLEKNISLRKEDFQIDSNLCKNIVKS